MNYALVTQQIAEYVRSYFAVNGSKELLYHDITHTESVVAAATQIARHYNLNEQDLFIVMAAAWFHDMGYCVSGTGMLHELKSAGLAEAFLREKGVEEDIITSVENCVMATKMPQHPVTLNEQIICDADLFHLGTDDFKKHSKQIRKEFEATRNISISKEEWRKGTIKLFQSHHYYTEYCQNLLNKKKEENLQKLLKKEKSDSPLPLVTTTEQKPNDFLASPPENIALKKVERPSKGIETMFRIAVTNHQRLSDMADKKANIMISVNSIIISVVIGLVVRKIETTPLLIAPTMLLLAGCVAAVVFSVLATRPKIPNGYFSPEQITGKTANLLFFGNFYNMDYQHYYDGMQSVMADSEFLYASLIRDIHSQGKVLGNKYKLLRISYTIFMFTLIVTILAFGASFFFM